MTQELKYLEVHQYFYIFKPNFEWFERLYANLHDLLQISFTQMTHFSFEP